MELMQGDQLEIAIQITDSTTGAYLTNADLSDVEISIGKITKNISSGVHFVADDNEWRFPLLQSETFMLNNSVPVQVRIKSLDGTKVRGIDLGFVTFQHSESRNVL